MRHSISDQSVSGKASFFSVIDHVTPMKRSLLTLIIHLSVVSPVLALPVDLSTPVGSLGSAGVSGNAQHWLELGDFSFGEGLALPLRLQFDSALVGGATDFGTPSTWWRAPEIHARVMQKTGSQRIIMLPCGKILYLYQSGDTFATPDGEWVGSYNKEQSFVVARADGWELEYGSAGWFTRLRTDSGRTILWNRDPNGRLTSISEPEHSVKASDGSSQKTEMTGLVVKRDKATDVVLGFEVRTEFGMKSYTLSYDEQQRLQAVVFPDGRSESYAYGLDKNQDPRMEISGRDLVTTSLSWHKTSHKLTSDGVWAYSIEPVKPGELYPRITRTGPHGETEAYFDGGITGKVEFKAADGTTTIRQKVLKGPAKGKLESITRLHAGKSDPIVTYRATFDSRGMIAEEFDALGRKTSHSYTMWGNDPHVGIQKHARTSPIGQVLSDEFDRQGNLISRTDPLGRTMRYTYDGQNRKTISRGPEDVIVERLAYTPAGLIASRTDALGHVTRYEYDAQGNRIKTIDPLGNTTTDEFDKYGNRIKTTNALGDAWSFEYDTASRLVRTIAPDGLETERRAYNAQGKLESVVDADGKTSSTEYDILGRVTAKTDALGHTTRYSYEAAQGAFGCVACNTGAKPTTITLPSGRKIQRRYNSELLLVEETAASATPQAATTRHEYDLVGNLIKTTDPLGRVTQYEYDATNRRTAVIYPDKTRRSDTYDLAGQIIAKTDELDHTTRRTFDPFGNLLAVTDPEGNSTTQSFESPAAAALRRVKNIRSAAGVVSSIQYDLAGRRVAEIIGDQTSQTAAITRHEFDAVGNEIKTTDPRGNVTTHTFDSRRRRIATQDSLGRVWKYSYSASGRANEDSPCCGAEPPAPDKAQSTIYPDGTQEWRVTDAAGRLKETVDAKGDKVKYSYDLDGHLIELTDGKGNVTRWTYDPRGNLESKVYPDQTVELYEHDAAGQLVARTRPDGNTALYAYDLRGRLLSERWKDGKAEPVDYKYDAAGHMVGAKNDSAAIERSYTANGKILAETQSISANFDNESARAEGSPPVSRVDVYNIGYTYDADGHVASITHPDGTKVGYRYSSLGELSEVYEAEKGGPAKTIATYERLLNGQTGVVNLGNGVKSMKTFDNAGRLEKIMHLSPGGTEMESEASRYDQRDRRTARIKSDGTADLFAYDPAGQVIAAAYGQAAASLPAPAPAAGPNAAQPAAASQEQGAEKVGFDAQQRFAYDPVGNRKEFQDLDGTKITYQTNAANQYTQVQVAGSSTAPNTIAVEPDYDKNGNLLKDPRHSYTWDADIHLLAVTTNSKSTHFRYDALHRRVAKLDADGTLTHFAHDGWNVIAEYSTPSSTPAVPKSLTLRLVWGEDLSHTLQGAGGAGGLLATHTFRDGRSADSNYFCYDSNGNVVLLTSAEGSASARYKYDVFGKTIASSGPAANLNRYRFSTKPVEQDSGLAFYGYRYYSPELGRWPSRDPFEEKGGLNLYVMVSNQPNLVVDADGRFGPLIAVPVITFTALEAAAAIAGVSMLACLTIPSCRDAATKMVCDTAAAAAVTSICAAYAAECVATKWVNPNPDYGSSKPCSDCYAICVGEGGSWPYWKCPL